MIEYNGQVLPLCPWLAVHFSSLILLNLKLNDCRVKWPCTRLCWTAARDEPLGKGLYSYQTHASLMGMVYWRSIHKKRFKIMLFRTKHNLHKLWGQSPLSSYKTTLRQQLNGKNDEKLDVKLIHLFVFGWAVLFSSPLLGRMLAWQVV